MMNNTSHGNETIFTNLGPFAREVINKILNHNLEQVVYDSLKSKQLITSISQNILESLSSVNKNFKYIVQVILVANGMAGGLDIGGLCMFDQEMDGNISVKYEGKGITAVVTLYGIAE